MGEKRSLGFEIIHILNEKALKVVYRIRDAIRSLLAIKEGVYGREKGLYG